MSHDLTSTDARAVLESASASAARMRRRARWASTRLLVLGTGLGLVTLAVGLVESTVLGVAALLAWGLLVLVTSLWVRRRTAHLPGTETRVAPYWTLSLVLYAVAVAAGGREQGDPGYWVPAAIVVALPMLVGSWRERRA